MGPERRAPGPPQRTIELAPAFNAWRHRGVIDLRRSASSLLCVRVDRHARAPRVGKWEGRSSPLAAGCRRAGALQAGEALDLVLPLALIPSNPLNSIDECLQFSMLGRAQSARCWSFGSVWEGMIVAKWREERGYARLAQPRQASGLGPCMMIDRPTAGPNTATTIHAPNQNRRDAGHGKERRGVAPGGAAAGAGHGCVLFYLGVGRSSKLHCNPPPLAIPPYIMALRGRQTCAADEPM